MSIKTKEEPGLLEGLSKEFFNDVPYSPFLTRGEQSLRGTLRGNEIATRSATALTRVESGQRRQEVAATRGAQEAADTREITEDTIAPTLQNIASSNVAITGRLQNLQSALEDTMGDLGEKVDGAVGIPTEKRDIDELIGNGSLDEAESIILAAKGFLNAEQRKKLQDSLPAWKVEIIRNGLVTRPDPKREKKFAAHEKIFLAELRRKSATPIEYFRSLEPVARHRMLDSEVHHALAKDLREVRFGTEGANYGIRELNTQMDTRNEQGAMGLSLQKVGLNFQEAGLAKQDQQIGIASRTLNVNTEVRDLARKDAVVQGSIKRSNTQISSHTKSIKRGIIISNLLAVRANIEATRIRRGITKLGKITTHYGELQAQQMNEAQAVRLKELELSQAMLKIGEQSKMLLADINNELVEQTGYAELHAQQLDRIDGRIENSQELSRIQIAHLEGVNGAIFVLTEVAQAHLESSGRIEVALERLENAVSAAGRNIANVIESVRVSLQEMESRTIERDLSPNRISARERYIEAMTMLKIGKVDNAIECFGRSIGDWSANYLPYLQRGLCHVKKEDSSKAEEDFSMSLDLVPGDQNRARAVIMWNLAKLSYSMAEIHFNNMHTQMHEEKLLQAVETAKEAVIEDPDFLETHFALATYLAASAHYEEALDILIEIIPKNPNFADKIKHFEAFEPLRDRLENTLAEEFNKESPNESKLAAHLTIAKDSILIGDAETALSCIRHLIQNGAQYLNASRFWEIDLFGPIREDIVKLLLEEIENDEAKDVPEEWYAIAAICMNFSEIKFGYAYRAFRSGANADPNFENESYTNVLVKLKEFMDGNTRGLLEFVVRVYPSDFPKFENWLRTYVL